MNLLIKGLAYFRSNFLECLALVMWRTPRILKSKAVALNADLLKKDSFRENPLESPRCLYIEVLIGEMGSGRLSKPLQLQLKEWLLVTATSSILMKHHPGTCAPFSCNEKVILLSFREPPSLTI